MSGALNAECANRPLCTVMPMGRLPEGDALNEECTGTVGGRGRGGGRGSNLRVQWVGGDSNLRMNTVPEWSAVALSRTAGK